MKTILYSLKGEKKGEIDLPKVFDTKIREDIVMKCFEAEKARQPYSPAREAGRRHSASGIISHQRHDWKGHYGKGIARVPRKVMNRSGQNFYWIGAEITSARGGRRVHGPKALVPYRKINKKEALIGRNSAFAATGRSYYLMQRYERLRENNIKVPIVLELNDIQKSKELFSALKIILGSAYELAYKHKDVRPGRGKLRGRKYKSNAGLLLVKGEKENIKLGGIDIKRVNEIKMADLYPLGRLTIYTRIAIEELGGKKP